MKIKSVHVEHFRSIELETLACDPLTVLVGANGAGKSSFLQALEVFYDVNARIEREDFFGRDTTRPIVIRVVYGNLREEETREFQSYLDDGELAVTKKLSLAEDGKVLQNYYGTTFQFPAFAPIRATAGKREQTAAWNELVKGVEQTVLQPVRNSAEIEPQMQRFELEHKDKLKPFERAEQFFGPRNVGGGKLDKFTKFVRLPAVREVTAEAVGRGGSLGQLLDTLVTRKLLAREDVQAFKKEYSAKLKALYAPDKTRDLQELAENISSTLGTYVPGAEFGLSFGELNLPDPPSPSAIPRLTEDGFEGDITRKGHGLQRSLIFTLLQHLAMLQREEGDEATGGPDLILAIEEPELYQHPQRCRYLADLLLELATQEGRGLGVGNQVIYTTHSAFFVSLDRFNHIRLVRKVKDHGPTPRSVVASFSMDDAAAQAAKAVAPTAMSAFTAERFRARAYPVMTTVVNEGFFANAVVVVEGMTEAGALWRISELLGLEWKQKNVVVIPAGGKTSIDRPVIIFNGLGIPVYFVFDADNRYVGKSEERSNANQNKVCLRLAGAAEADFPSNSVTDTWACFEDDFEGYCSSVVGNAKFNEYRKAVAEKYGYDKESDVLKNFDAIGDFVERLRSDGHSLPNLEDIARRITKLCT